MTARLTTEQLDALERLEKAASPAGWCVEDGTDLVWGRCNPDDHSTYGMGYPIVTGIAPRPYTTYEPQWPARVANASLIAESRNDLPALIAAARNEAVLRGALEAIADWQQWDLPEGVSAISCAALAARKALGIES